MSGTFPRRPLSTYITSLMWLQGGYFVLFGIWPLISIRSFKLVTGEKTDHLVTGRESDHWLVMTVSLLLISIGLPLLLGAWRRRYSKESIVLSICSALSLAFIDFIYVARNVILPVYLVDGAIQVAFLAGWVVIGVWQRLQATPLD